MDLKVVQSVSKAIELIKMEFVNMLMSIVGILVNKDTAPIAIDFIS